jgi:hypothetical protein
MHHPPALVEAMHVRRRKSKPVGFTDFTHLPLQLHRQSKARSARSHRLTAGRNANPLLGDHARIERAAQLSTHQVRLDVGCPSRWSAGLR